MNKEINQLINKLHLDPKKEAAVRKIVENVGSNNSGGGNGPVIIEYPFYGNEAVTLTDEQINAVKDGNIKIKLTVPDNNACAIVLPEFYEISDDEAYISVYQPSLEGGRSNVVYLVNNANKTITKE